MLRFILLTGLYVLGTWYADAFIAGPDQVTLFWPSAGIALRRRAALRLALVAVHPGGRAHRPPDLRADVPASFLPFSVMSNFLGALAGA